LKAVDTLHGTRGYLLASAPAAARRVAALGGVAVAYYLAARLGLALLSAPSDVAVFWPASGIAAGILIIANRRVWPTIVVGVILGTVVANLMGDRNIWTSLFKGFCNAGEAVLVAGLIERWFGRPFAFDDLRRVLGFVAAACLGAAASALGGAATMTLFHTAAPYWDVWRAWFLSDGVGIVMVAPLVIGFNQVWRKPPSRAEAIEAIGVLSLLALISWIAVTHPTGSWLSFDPDAVALPLLLWLVARCDPSFGIAGAFIVSLTAIYATIFGIGHFGNPDLSIVERVSGAQVLITMVTLYTLVLAALFAKCKQTEARLSNALEAGQVMAFEWDAVTGLTQRSDNAPLILGDERAGVAGNNFLRRVHADDRERFKTHVRQLSARNSSYLLNFRFVRPDGKTVWLEETAKGEFDTAGRLLRIKGLTRDITDRKRAEDALAERNAQLALAGMAALVGTYEYDFDTNRMRISEGYAAIHGLPEGTTEIPHRQWRAAVHPEDLGRIETQRDQAYRERRREYTAEHRIVRRGEVRWIEARKFISYDGNGQPRQVVGVNIDVTERKRVEEQQRVLLCELDHRVKNALATVSAVASHTLNTSSSMVDFATALDGRVQSMARTHELLSASRWQGISVAELVQRELAPYATSGNTEINGPEIRLRAEAGQVMAMVLHELATNAAKYGALSTRNGRVSIRWGQRSIELQRSHLVLEWQEIGGPSVVAPENSGFGTRTIRDLIPYELGGSVDLSLAPDGVRCRVELPANWLSNDGDPVSEAVARQSPRR